MNQASRPRFIRHLRSNTQLFALGFFCLTLNLLSACSDELNLRGSRNGNSNPSTPDQSSGYGQNFLTDANSPFQAQPWPQPKSEGYIAEVCPPPGENLPCTDDRSAVIAAVDIMSRALHTHASISLEEAVATVIKLAKLHPNAKILAILSQIATCSQKITTTEYETALKTYHTHESSLRYISAGRKKFLNEKGIFVPTLPTDASNDQLFPKTKLSLREALDRFGDRSIPMESGQVDMDGKPILSAGALRCTRALAPLMVQKFVTESSAYPVTLSIIAPGNSQSLLPGTSSTFEAKLTNTYDVSNLSWSIPQEYGSITYNWGSSKATLTIHSWIKSLTTTTIQLQYFSYEGSLNAETQIKITPKTEGQ